MQFSLLGKGRTAFGFKPPWGWVSLVRLSCPVNRVGLSPNTFRVSLGLRLFHLCLPLPPFCWSGELTPDCIWCSSFELQAMSTLYPAFCLGNSLPFQARWPWGLCVPSPFRDVLCGLGRQGQSRESWLSRLVCPPGGAGSSSRG